MSIEGEMKPEEVKGATGMKGSVKVGKDHLRYSNKTFEDKKDKRQEDSKYEDSRVRVLPLEIDD